MIQTNDVSFSIVIPLFNKEKEIERTIDSVLKQTYQRFEIIVIDDGSTDSGPEKVRAFNHTKIFLVSKNNMGVSSARNRGIQEANYELISFLDADDTWKPNYLETILRMRAGFPNSGLYSTAYEIVTSKISRKISCFNGIPSTNFEGILANYFRQSLGELPLCTSAVTVPKQIFTRIGTFMVGEVMGEDIEMWGRIAMRFPIAYSTDRCAIYYQDATNRACQNFDRSCLRTSPFVRTAAKAIEFGHVPSEQISDLKNYMAHLQLIAAHASLMQGKNPEIARKMLHEIHASDIKLNLIKFKLLIASFFPLYILMRLSEFFHRVTYSP
jgi:glycosyltransferase involved in cell wall biosynthesis